MSSRDHILNKLRGAKRPFAHANPPSTYRHMVPTDALDQSALIDRFVQEAEKASCVVHRAGDAEEAIEAILQVIGADTAVSSWQFDHIPIPGLKAAFAQANIETVGQDATVRVGLTGVDAALAATGSVVVMSGNGRYRTASLLPPVHIAVVAANQILPDLEGWWQQQRQQGLQKTRESSNIAIISGPSRTADIGMKLVMGMHGPEELHIVLINS